MGKFGSRAWLDFLKLTSGMNSVTSPDTYVYLKKSHSGFEAQNYGAVCETAQDDGVLTKLTASEIESNFPTPAKNSILDAIRINGEFTFSTFNLFIHLDSLLKRTNVRVLNGKVRSVNLAENSISLMDSSAPMIKYDRVILCAGARTSQLLPANKIMPIFQGVGVALLLDEVKDLEMNKLRRGVFRSVNRGGAQCGIHLVPREDGKFYLGAGNYVSRVEDPKIRFDTIRYLLDTLSEDLIGKNLRYELTGSIKLGLRPRALDGFPMIGPISSHQNAFVATATNRAGLTWAPYISAQIENWISGMPQDSLISDWLPDRRPIPFGTLGDGISYFTESRISNALEHGLISNSESELEIKRNEFKSVAHKLAAEVSLRVEIDEGYTVNPDNWAAICSIDK
jgi:glycine/D-amino acid oxidase-like deaminating enzyme